MWWRRRRNDLDFRQEIEAHLALETDRLVREGFDPKDARDAARQAFGSVPRLEAIFGPVRGSLLLGLLWTGWHLPLFWYTGWTSSPLWIYVLFLMGQSFILSYATNLARFGIITPIAMHATFNTVSRFLGGLFADTQPNAPIPFVLVMALCGLATAAVLILATGGRLAYRKDSSLT
jgi:hypothetical protein